jgi:hypothetical protein
MRAKFPLHVLVLFQKIAMGYVESRRLQIAAIQTDDRYLITEFLDQRISQLIVNNTIQAKTIEINIHNTLN